MSIGVAAGREAGGEEADPLSAGIRSGSLEVRLARGQAEIEASQALRYQVFYEEMSARPSPDMAAKRRDIDDFDAICDHLLVFDHEHGGADGGPAVVGTYRLLRQDVAEQHGGFYTAKEFDIDPLIARQPRGTRFLELGRSCTHADYRTKMAIELLWRGIMAYNIRHGIDVMFGCASLPGNDPDALALPLSFLYHQCLAPAEWCVRAHEHLFVEMNRIPKDEIDLKAALRALPPLIKGYVRAGAYIGDGAYIDRQFNTTDVLIILPIERVDPRYKERFGPRG
jgi:putative hemolysin